MFNDKVYDELDDISKLVEPYNSEFNNIISQYPDEIEIHPSVFKGAFSGGWGFSSVRVETILDVVAKNLNLPKLTRASSYDSRVDNFFEFEIKDLEEYETPTFNFETDHMSHTIILKKVKLGLDDQELSKLAKNNILNAISGNLHNNRSVNKPRLNEIAELFGAQEAKSDRSYRGKVKKLCKRLEQLIDDQKLDIRDIELCKKFGQWVVKYVKDGNLPALNNVTRIKIMMHKNRPIYSIEERKTV